MPVEAREASLYETLEADWLRVQIADYLAECELGPPPRPLNKDAFVDYWQKRNDLRQEIFRRIN